MISFIIPVYNAEKSVLPLLDSICNNMQIPYEILCVNDGSTDMSEKIISEYCLYHPEVKLISQKNKGPSAARNLGIRSAIGDWIMFADSDDLYTKEGLITAQTIIKEKIDIDVCIFSYIEMKNENSQIIGINRKEIFNCVDFLKIGYTEKNYLYMHSCWNKIYKKSIIDSIGTFDETIRLGEDAIFNVEYLSKTKKILIENVPLYLYFVRKGSLSSEKKCLQTLWDSYLTISSAVEGLLKSNNLNKLAEEVFTNYYLGAISSYLNQNSIDDGSTLFIMFSNRQWTERLKIERVQGIFFRLLYYMIIHNHNYIAINLCKIRKKRKGKKQ